MQRIIYNDRSGLLLTVRSIVVRVVSGGEFSIVRDSINGYFHIYSGQQFVYMSSCLVNLRNWRFTYKLTEKQNDKDALFF